MPKVASHESDKRGKHERERERGRDLGNDNEGTLSGRGIRIMC